MKRKQSKKTNRTIYILAGIFSGVGCILMVVFPELALSAADRGLSLFLNSVLPSLLPFFICANFMIALGIPAVIGRYFEGLFRQAFRAPGVSAFVFVISITSGYPMGAKLIGDMGRRGEISVLDGKRMMAFCTTSGPLFMLGTVGASMLGQSRAGVVIAMSHYGAALLNGLLFRFFLDRSGQRLPPMGATACRRRPPATGGDGKAPLQSGILEEFTHAILSSFQTLGVICGYIVLFTLLTDFLQFSGVLNLFSAVWQKGVAKGLLEMTVGAGSIAASGEISMVLKCALCSMLISFGGISIMAQSISMLSGFDISVWYYLKVKVFHGFIAFGLALLIGSRLLSGAVETGSFGSAETVHSLGSFYGLLFSVKMVIMVLILFAATCMVQGMIDRFLRGRQRRLARREQRTEKKLARQEELSREKEQKQREREQAKRKKERQQRMDKQKMNQEKNQKNKQKKKQEKES